MTNLTMSQKRQAAKNRAKKRAKIIAACEALVTKGDLIKGKCGHYIRVVSAGKPVQPVCTTCTILLPRLQRAYASIAASFAGDEHAWDWVK